MSSSTHEANTPSSRAAVRWLREAARLARHGIRLGDGGPFGAVVVRDDAIIGRGWNRVVARNDPSAHAEVVALRDACARLQRFHLTDCVLYATCEPCPMCLGAIYWARVPRVVYASTREEAYDGKAVAHAARIGFADDHIHRELALEPARRHLAMRRVEAPDAAAVLEEWRASGNRTLY